MYGLVRRLGSFASVSGLALAGLVGAASAQDTGADFAALSAEADSLKRHSEYLERAIVAQQSELDSLRVQINGLDATGAAFADLLPRMFADFEKFVGADLPFQMEERTKRVDRLRDMMADAATSPAEKYRRLLEAYQIEMDYGRTMESYGGSLPEKGAVRFVRLGRVALMYSTVDGAESGYWDAAQKTWIVDPAYDAGILKAIRIALQEVTADLINVPIPAATQGK